MSDSRIGRFGLAITAPRRALAIALAPGAAGRAGSDLLVALAMLLVAGELRWLVEAGWLGIAVDPALGAAALVHVVTTALAIDLGVLAIAVGVLAIAMRSASRGARPTDVGRAALPEPVLGAIDLASVAVLPLVFVDLAASVASSVVAPPELLRWLAIAWTGALVALAIWRRPAERPGAPRAGWIVVALALAGTAVQVSWVARHADLVRPLAAGAQAPAFALPRIGQGGALGERVSIAPGHITVLDFWATWCQPCLHALPALDRVARAHPDVDVIAINLDDPAAARALFDRAHYSLQLVADDGAASERYGVTAIPRTIVIGRDGVVAADRTSDLEAVLARLRERQ